MKFKTAILFCYFVFISIFQWDLVKVVFKWGKENIHEEIPPRFVFWPLPSCETQHRCHRRCHLLRGGKMNVSSFLGYDII